MDRAISKHSLERRVVEEEEVVEVVEVVEVITASHHQPGPTPDTGVSLMHSGMEITGTI